MCRNRKIFKKQAAKPRKIKIIALSFFLAINLPLYIEGKEKTYQTETRLFFNEEEGKGKEDSVAIARKDNDYTANEEICNRGFNMSIEQKKETLLSIGHQKKGLAKSFKNPEPGCSIAKSPKTVFNIKKIHENLGYAESQKRISKVISPTISEKILLLTYQNPGEIKANVSAFRENVNTHRKERLWSSLNALPEKRSIWRIVSDETENLNIEKLRGFDAKKSDFSNLLKSPFGNFIGTEPVVVGKPPFFYPFGSYLDFAEKTVREQKIYFQSNTGSLHALRLYDGKEVWCILPLKYLDKTYKENKTQQVRKPENFKENHNVKDGSLKVSDIFANLGDGKKEWRTMLVAGIESQKSSYLAIDITNGHGFDDNDSPELLWIFSHKKIGTNLSNPSIERISVSENPKNADWGVYFTSSYDDTSLSKLENNLFAITAGNAGDLWIDNKGNKISNILISRLPNDSLTDLLAVDFQGDFIADNIYVGNRYGDMFRVRKIGKHMTPEVSKLFSFNNDKYIANPINNKAGYAYGPDPDQVWIYFGTGAVNPHEKEKYTRQQFFIGLKDSINNIKTSYLQDLISLKTEFYSTMVNKEKSKIRILKGKNPDKQPWKLVLNNQPKMSSKFSYGAETVTSKPLIVGGVVIFASFIVTGHNTYEKGETWITALDSNSGLAPQKPVFDLNSDGRFNQEDMIKVDGKLKVPIGIKVCQGIGSRPILHKNKLVMTIINPPKKNGVKKELQSQFVEKYINLPNMKVRLESWKNKKHRNPSPS